MFLYLLQQSKAQKERKEKDNMNVQPSDNKGYLEQVSIEIRKVIRQYLKKIGANPSFSAVLKDSEVLTIRVDGLSRVDDLADYVYDTIGDPMLSIDVVDDNTLEIRNATDRNTSVEGSKNYGGAFDVDPEMFFTRDDLDEMNEAVLDHIQNTLYTGDEYRIAESYIDGNDNNHIYIEIEDVEEGVFHSADAYIDMRKIRRPSDLKKKYGKILGDQLVASIKQYIQEMFSYDDVESSTTVNGAYENGMLPGPGDYDPPEYDEPEYADEEVDYINVMLDADIIIDEEGRWEYADESYPWAQSGERNGDWYSYEYSRVHLDDPVGVVEKVDELMADKLPSEPGRYHVTGNVNLYYSTTGIEVSYYSEGPDETGEVGYDAEYYTDNATTKYVAEESTLEDFQCVPSSVGASTKICAGVTFGESKPASSNRYDMYANAQYRGTQFSIYYNQIDTSPEADPMDMLNAFRAQISEIHPYDDGNYLSAVLQNGVISYRVSGQRPTKQSYYSDADTLGVENGDWCDAVIEQAIMELRQLNSSVKSKMVHN